jgi:hypothetical protein
MRATACSTVLIHCPPVISPSENTTEDGGRGGVRGGSGSRGLPRVVRHQVPSRCPTTTSGTTSTDEPVAGSKLNDPKATRPVPGRQTSSVTAARAASSSHHACASAKRPAPVSAKRALSPQPTRPLAALHPRQRALLGEQVQQRTGVVDAHGGDREQRRLGRGEHTSE